MNNYYYTNNNDNNEVQTKSFAKTRDTSIAKVFGYMFLGLLVTAISALGIYYLLRNTKMTFNQYNGILIASSIFSIVLIFIAQIKSFSGKFVGSLVTFMLFAISMGVMLSSLLLQFNIQFLGFVFLVTSGVFGVMALYGLISKQSAATLGMFACGAIFGALMISMVNIFLRSSAMFWAISYITLAAMLAFTAFDVFSAKRLAQEGLLSNSMAVYIALVLYTDFIYIFVRLVVIIAASVSDR